MRSARRWRTWRTRSSRKASGDRPSAEPRAFTGAGVMAGVVLGGAYRAGEVAMKGGPGSPHTHPCRGWSRELYLSFSSGVEAACEAMGRRQETSNKLRAEPL
jgi:hypothetical protein